MIIHVKKIANSINFFIDDSLVVFYLVKYCDDDEKKYMPECYIKYIDYIYVNHTSFFEKIQSFSMEEYLQVIDYINKNHEMIENVYYEEVFNNIFLYFSEVVEEFDNYFEVARHFLSEKIGFEIENKHNIYVVPHFFHISCTYNNTIFYGTVFKYPHIINLLHELMHCYFKDNDISHAIIELSTNGELIKYLFNINDKSIYLSGHWYLIKIKKKILKSWTCYINSKGKKNLSNFYLIQVKKNLKQAKSKYCSFSDHVISLPGYTNTILIKEEDRDLVSIPTKLYNKLVTGKIDYKDSLVKKLFEMNYLELNSCRKNISINTFSTYEKKLIS